MHITALRNYRKSGGAKKTLSPYPRGSSLRYRSENRQGDIQTLKIEIYYPHTSTLHTATRLGCEEDILHAPSS